MEQISQVTRLALEQAGSQEIDAIAVTQKLALVGALLVGIAAATYLWVHDKPLIVLSIIWPATNKSASHFGLSPVTDCPGRPYRVGLHAWNMCYQVGET